MPDGELKADQIGNEEMNSEELAKDPLMIDLRKTIDNIDSSFMYLLAERMRVVEKILFLKRSQKIDPKRSEARMEEMRQLIELSTELKLEPAFFRRILDLVFREALVRFDKTTDENLMASICDDLELDVLRQSLLNLEKSLCLILAERFKTVKRIGSYKRRLGVPYLDGIRWRHLLDHKVAAAESVGISPSLIKEVFTAIHEVSLCIEDSIDG